MQGNNTEKFNNDLETEKDNQWCFNLPAEDWSFSHFCQQIVICGMWKYCRMIIFDFLQYAGVFSNMLNRLKTVFDRSYKHL